MKAARPLAALAAAPIAAGLLAGCAGSAPSLPACSTGHGGGHTATLTIHQDGAHFTGTYLVGIGGGISLRYGITGTTHGSRLTSTVSFGAIEMPVTGTYTAGTITLDNPGGKFSITRFTQATGCPAS